MFKEFGQIASLMKNLPKIREEMENLQQRIGQITAEGDAGGGMVKIKMNGRMEVLACNISEDVLRMNDREMLEDLVRAAFNKAAERTRQAVADETGKMASGLGLPPGMGLPGLP